jgi:hypothetical protein
VVACSLIGGGLLSIYLGKDLSWDLASYHYYNAFSFLQQRWQVDYWPVTFIQGYFTPTLDFLAFFLINHLSPKTTTFCLGALHGLNAGLLFAIASCCLKMLPTLQYPRWTALVLSLLGLYGPIALSGLGSFQQDETVSLFILSFVFLQLKFWQRDSKNSSYGLFFSSCLLLGLGMGCKLTAGIFVSGALLAFLFLPQPWKQRLPLLGLAAVGLSGGLLISSGYWMLFLWQHYQNPFFPFWNKLFHSPAFPFYNWHDPRFLPKGWRQNLFFPFYFSWNGQTNDLPFRDFRFAVLYLLAACQLVAILRKKIATAGTAVTPIAIQWFFLFFLFSYIAWQSYFAIMRYIVSLEMLAPLTIYLLLYRLLVKATIREPLAIGIFIFIATTMIPVQAIRAPWYDADYFNIKLPPCVKTTPRALVLVPFPRFALAINPRPQNYLLPFFPATWRIVGIPFWQEHAAITPETAAFITAHAEKNLYLLAATPDLPPLYKLAASWGFKKPEPCEPLSSDRQKMTGQHLFLCLVKK